SRLVSPPFVVPSVTENPRLRFWHWYSFFGSHSAVVEVTEADGQWQQISPAYMFSSSAVWSRPSLDLGTFAGKTVQVAFHIKAAACCGEAPGWYIDEVAVEKGPL